MNDKEKQIEEIDSAIRSHFGCQYGYKIYFTKYSGYNYIEVYTRDIATTLYEQGSRKIDKGSVVIPEKITEETSPETLIKIAKYNEKVRKQAIKEFAERLHSSLDKGIPALNGVLVMLVKNIVDNTAKELGVKLQKSVEICKNTQKHANFENHTSDPDWN